MLGMVSGEARVEDVAFGLSSKAQHWVVAVVGGEGTAEVVVALLGGDVEAVDGQGGRAVVEAVLGGTVVEVVLGWTVVEGSGEVGRVGVKVPWKENLRTASFEIARKGAALAANLQDGKNQIIGLIKSISI